MTFSVAIFFIQLSLLNIVLKIIQLQRNCNCIANFHLKHKFSFLFENIYFLNVVYLFGVLRYFQHCTGHITTGSWKGRGNQYIQFVGVLYCKLPTNRKQIPAFPLETVPGTKPQPQRWGGKSVTTLPPWHLECSLKTTQKCYN